MDTLNPNETVKPQGTESASPVEAADDVLLVRMWPKTPVLYPVAVLALLFSIFGHFWGSSPHLNRLKEITAVTASAPADQTKVMSEVNNLVSGYKTDRILGAIFLLVLAFSLFTLCVDFEVRWALITFSSALVVLLFLYILNERWGFLPGFLQRLARLTPIASPQFYMGFFIIWVILMGISLAIVRFHYVKIESNEVLVIGGIMERQQRYPTMGMKFDKDVQDVIEYYLPFVRSGRLILTFHEGGTIVIDNVIEIEKVIARLDKITGILNVNR